MVEFLDSCRAIHGQDFMDHHNVVLIYRDFIIQLKKEIQNLSGRFHHWYQFKRDSSLKSYLLEHHIILDAYFTPTDLCDVLTDLFQVNNLDQNRNPDIYILNSELQLILNSYIAYKPRVLELCMPHLLKATDEVQIQLQQKHVQQNILVFCPKNIIYQDPTAVFYLYHQVNQIMGQTRFVYTYQDLVNTFYDFCTTDQEHFSHTSDFIEVKDDSPIALLLPFKYFHIDQIESIVQKLSMYLGRKGFLTYSCPYFKKPLFPNQCFDKILKFIEDKMEETILPQFVPTVQL